LAALHFPGKPLDGTDAATSHSHVFAILNGQIIDSSAATLPISDRGFLYGDGLFETIRLENGVAINWPNHWARFQTGANFLRMPIAASEETLRIQISELLNANGESTALVRIQLTRGSGMRGYSPKNAGPPTLLLTQHAAPQLPENAPVQCTLITAKSTLPANDPLLAFKTCNRLHHILARAEADEAGADEALLLNQQRELACASAANIFLLKGDELLTPPVESGALPGVTRASILKLAASLNLKANVRSLQTADLQSADGVFLTQSSRGIVEVTHFDGSAISHSPATAAIYRAWRAKVLAP